MFTNNSCIIVQNIKDVINLPETLNIKKFNLIYSLDYVLNDHFLFNNKFKIFYANQIDFGTFLLTKKIKEVFFFGTNPKIVQKAFIFAEFFKQKKIKINFYFKNEFLVDFSSEFDQRENNKNEYWNWNYKKSKFSSMQIINLSPFIRFVKFKIGWPIYKSGFNLFQLSKLEDNEGNFNQNVLSRTNQHFKYQLNPFEVKKIYFSFNKKFSFEENGRNLNFRVISPAIEKKILKSDIFSKKNFFKDLIQNFYKNIKFLDNKMNLILEITAYKDHEKFQINKIKKNINNLKNIFISFDNE